MNSFEFLNGIQLLGHSVSQKESLYSRCEALLLFVGLAQGAMVLRLLSKCCAQRSEGSSCNIEELECTICAIPFGH